MVAHIPVAATKADVLRVSAANPGWRVERDSAGTLSLVPPTGGRSGIRNVALTGLIAGWAEKHGFVAFDSSTGFEFDDGAIVSPDAAALRAERWHGLSIEQREDFVPLVPDVAVELASRFDRPSDLRAKLLDLRKRGAAYVLLLDPYRPSASVWSDGQAPPGFPITFTDVLAAD